MPIEFLRGRPLSLEELELIRRQIEEGFEVIAAVDDEIRGIVARNWLQASAGRGMRSKIGRASVYRVL
jgi:hypothetical protein